MKVYQMEIKVKEKLPIPEGVDAEAFLHEKADKVLSSFDRMLATDDSAREVQSALNAALSPYLPVVIGGKLIVGFECSITGRVMNCYPIDTGELTT